MEKYGGTREATDDDILWHMLCMTEATATHSEYEYVIFIAFPQRQWF
jgi:hypothetical protein